SNRSCFWQYTRFSYDNIQTKVTASSQRPRRQSSQLLHLSVVNTSRSTHASKINSKKKQLVEYKGPKTVKIKVKATQAEDVELSKEDTSKEANELMVEETPPPTYWKEFMEKRWQNLSFSVLQENEKLHETSKPRRSRFQSFRTRKRSHNGWHKSNTCLDGACLGKDLVEGHLPQLQGHQKWTGARKNLNVRLHPQHGQHRTSELMADEMNDSNLFTPSWICPSGSDKSAKQLSGSACYRDRFAAGG
uniref:Uncharacterized protein n=1 Tax=Salarias fasciatus TaxID=181472 RepID=A0A672GGT5_SALFA